MSPEEEDLHDGVSDFVGRDIHSRGVWARPAADPGLDPCCGGGGIGGKRERRKYIRKCALHAVCVLA